MGLWLAEGYRRASREITLTNNNSDLIDFFHRVIWQYFRPQYLPRVYVYRPTEDERFVTSIPNANYKMYLDSRASKPYYIYRISGVGLVKEWRRAVEVACSSPSNYRRILQGFFAGEGNIKEDLRTGTRALRIAQGKRHALLERILNHFQVEFTYRTAERSYVITGRDNLEKLWKLRISELHSIKHAKFDVMLASYKQHHYKRTFLNQLALEILVFPMTTREIAHNVGRTESRAQKVLSQLRKECKVRKFKVRSSYYWTRYDNNEIVISNEKRAILDAISQPRRLFEISRMVGKTEKSVSKRLSELVGLGLALKVNSNWTRIDPGKRVIVK